MENILLGVFFGTWLISGAIFYFRKSGLVFTFGLSFILGCIFAIGAALLAEYWYLAAIIFGACVYYISPLSKLFKSFWKLISEKDGLNQHFGDPKNGKIKYFSSQEKRVDSVLEGFSSIVSDQWFTPPFFRLIKNEEFMREIAGFHSAYFDRLGQNIVAFVNGKSEMFDEDIRLFAEKLGKKHIVSGILFVKSVFYYSLEKEYFDLYQYLEAKKIEGYKDIIEQAAIYYIHHSMDDGRNLGYSDVERYLREKNIRAVYGKVQGEVIKAIEQKKIEQIEKNIEKGQPVKGSLFEQMRIETINDFYNFFVAHNFDPHPDNYVIVQTDFERENSIDRFYKRKFYAKLATTFSGKCAKCHDDSPGLELDHFWIPKSSGGNFLMRHKGKGFVNNCIPLCRTCNASKGKKQFFNFFETNELEIIIEKCQSMNQYINTHSAELDSEFSEFEDEETEKKTG